MRHVSNITQAKGPASLICAINNALVARDECNFWTTRLRREAPDPPRVPCPFAIDCSANFARRPDPSFQVFNEC
jgi:hypothetical protein